MKKTLLAIAVFILAGLLAYYFWPSERKYFTSVQDVNASTSLKLSLPFSVPSFWGNFTTKNGKFVAQPKDTWFVYGWFGKIASIKSVGGIQYQAYGNQHGGIDFSAKIGIPVIAAADGVVTFVGDFYGKTIRISHQDGFETIYGHLSEIDAVNNQKIKRGEVIGKVGATGTVNPHLHFEVDRRVNNDLWAINPRKLLTTNWSKVMVPDVPANHFYSGDPNNPDAQKDFVWPR